MYCIHSLHHCCHHVNSLPDSGSCLLTGLLSPSFFPAPVINVASTITFLSHSSRPTIPLMTCIESVRCSKQNPTSVPWHSRRSSVTWPQPLMEAWNILFSPKRSTLTFSMTAGRLSAYTSLPIRYSSPGSDASSVQTLKVEGSSLLLGLPALNLYLSCSIYHILPCSLLFYMSDPSALVDCDYQGSTNGAFSPYSPQSVCLWLSCCKAYKYWLTESRL